MTRLSTSVAAFFFTTAVIFFGAQASLAAPGVLDPTFGTEGKVVTVDSSFEWNASDSVMLPDGRFAVAGQCATRNTQNICVAMYLKNGELDRGFGVDGKATAVIESNLGLSMRLQGTDKLLVAATCPAAGRWSFCLLRFDLSGQLDESFGTGGISLQSVSGATEFAYALAIHSDGRIAVAGLCTRGVTLDPYDLCVATYSADGGLVSSFAGGSGFFVFRTSGYEWVAKAIHVLPNDDGYIVAAQCYAGNVASACLAKIDVDGVLTSSFGSGGFVAVPMGPSTGSFYVADLFRNSDGTLSVLHDCGSLGQMNSCITRFLSTGSIDTSFGTNGTVTLTLRTGATPCRASSLQLYETQNSVMRYLLGGLCPNPESTSSVHALLGAVVSESGVPDTSFGTTGIVTVPFSMMNRYHIRVHVRAEDKKVLLTSSCGQLAYPYSNGMCLARLKGGPYPASACTLNTDANNAIAASSDAMLVTRYLLGFQGEALTNGAIGQNATRTAEEIVTYLDSLKNDPARKLDIDGDGLSLAMTDGLLMLRAMLGLSGDALTVGAMGQTSVAFPTLRTPQQILQWIEATHGVACLP